MAFIIDNFSTIGSNARKGEAPQQFSFESATDNIATIKAGNYFGEVAFQLSADDMISVIAIDGMAIFHVLTSDPVAGTVTIDSNVISNQGGSDSSASFHNIFKLSDFTFEGGNIKLENGVNYQVFIEGPIATDATFFLETPYDKGGSLKYMGNQQVLKWTFTNGQATDSAVFGAGLEPGSDFLLEGFDFFDDDGNLKNAVEMSGVSKTVKMSSLAVRNCTFNKFPGGVTGTFVVDVDIDNLVVTAGGVSSTSAAVDLLRAETVSVTNCDLETTGPFLVFLLQTIDLKNANFDNTKFRKDTAGGALDLSAISQGGDPGAIKGPVIVSNCAAFLGTEINPDGFAVRKFGAIGTIKNNGSGKIRVRPRKDNTVSLGETVQISNNSSIYIFYMSF